MKLLLMFVVVDWFLLRRDTVSFYLLDTVLGFVSGSSDAQC